MRGTMQDEGTRCVIYSVQFVSCSPVLTTAVLQMLATCSCRRIAALIGDGFSSAQPLIVTNQLRFLQIPNSEQRLTRVGFGSMKLEVEDKDNMMSSLNISSLKGHFLVVTLHYPMLAKNNYTPWATKMKVFMQ
ncbi:hypothetical protein LXL04_006984 [Taraxacum kok-saghyz]